jgi:putative copper export protein
MRKTALLQQSDNCDHARGDPEVGRAGGDAVVPRERHFGWEVWMRFSWAVTYKLGTIVAAGALAVLAFSQGTQWWDIVGAVLTGSAIADVILLTAAAWFRWRHRSEWSSRPDDNA